MHDEAGFNRSIETSSLRLDDHHVQVRGQLTDRHDDFENPGGEVIVHCLVVRLTISTKSGLITVAEFGTPRMAFPGRCEQLPYGAELLVGQSIRGDFSQRIKSLYGGNRSCLHLESLLQAMVPALPQCQLWNTLFKDLDDNLPPTQVPKTLKRFERGVQDSCHAWAKEDGFIVQDFKKGHYDGLLSTITPKLLARWRLYNEDDNS